MLAGQKFLTLLLRAAAFSPGQSRPRALRVLPPRGVVLDIPLLGAKPGQKLARGTPPGLEAPP